jgi:ZIP family zinc transporter
VAGSTLLGGVSPTVLAAITALAAGANLTMVADTMIPEAFEAAHLAIIGVRPPPLGAVSVETAHS